MLPYDDAFAVRVTIDLGGIFRGGGRGRRGRWISRGRDVQKSLGENREKDGGGEG